MNSRTETDGKRDGEEFCDINVAAAAGDLERVKELTKDMTVRVSVFMKNSNAINPMTSALAAASGNLELMKYLSVTLRCRMDCTATAAAARKGDLPMLQYLFERSCPRNELTCSNAAFNGHLDVLKWARQNRCPWDAMTIYNAARGGYHQMLKYAIDGGCPMPDKQDLQELINHVETKLDFDDGYEKCLQLLNPEDPIFADLATVMKFCDEAAENAPEGDYLQTCECAMRIFRRLKGEKPNKRRNAGVVFDYAAAQIRRARRDRVRPLQY